MLDTNTKGNSKDERKEKKRSEVKRDMRYLQQVTQLPNYLPFMPLDFVSAKLHVAHVRDFVDRFFVLVSDVEHVVGGVPSSSDVVGYHAGLKTKTFNDPIPLGKGDGAGVFYCVRKFANLS